MPWYLLPLKWQTTEVYMVRASSKYAAKELVEDDVARDQSRESILVQEDIVDDGEVYYPDITEVSEREAAVLIRKRRR